MSTDIAIESPKKLMTVQEFEEFLDRPENAHRDFELYRGEVREVSRPTQKHGIVIGNFCRILGNYSFDQNRGYVVGGDAGVILETDPATVVGPDVAYFTDVARFADVHPKWGGALPILVVEVRSPNDKPGHVQDKIDAYLESGVKIVWSVDYEDRQVTIYRPDQEPQVIGASETIGGEPELPGLTCRVAEFFRLPGDRPGAPDVPGD
jgi:Uma2 family endonuclease